MGHDMITCGNKYGKVDPFTLQGFDIKIEEGEWVFAIDDQGVKHLVANDKDGNYVLTPTKINSLGRLQTDSSKPTVHILKTPTTPTPPKPNEAINSW